MGPELRLVTGNAPVPADLAAEGEFAWAAAGAPAGETPRLQAHLAAAEAEQARAGTPVGRARLRAAGWLCVTGAYVHAGCRALAERVAP